MISVFVERFWLLLVICIAAWLFFAQGAYQQRGKFWSRATRYSPFVFLLLLAVNVLVVTPRERICRQVERLARACQDGSVAELDPLIDDGFSSDGMDKKDLLARCEKAFSRIKIGKTTFLGISVQGRTATVDAWTGIRSQGGEDAGSVKSKWSLEFKDTPAGPLLERAKPLLLHDVKVESLREIFYAADSF